MYEDLKDWLQKCNSTDHNAYCKYCRKPVIAKLYDLQAHAKTLTHQQNAKPFSDQRQTKISSIVRRFEGTRGVRGLKVRRTQCTAILSNVVCPHFESILRENMGEVPYALLVDESTDIAVTKQLGICIRYFSERAGEPITSFLSLVVLEAGNAAAIVKGIKEVLARYKLDIQKMRGLGSDNASVVTGCHDGVFAMLQREVPHLVLVRCVCHSIQLAVAEATARLPSSLEYLIRETYSWFSRSASRQHEYKLLFGAMNNGVEPLKLTRVVPTRWLSVETFTSRMLSQWDELKLHFEQAANKADKCFAASTLAGMFKNPLNRLFLLYIQPTLEDAQRVNKMFQSETADPSQLLPELKMLIRQDTNKGISCKKKVANFLNPRRKLETRNSLDQRLDKLLQENLVTEEAVREMRDQCYEFMETLVTELQDRLPSQMKILQEMSVLSPRWCLREAGVPKCLSDLAKVLHFPQDLMVKVKFQWEKLKSTEWKEKKHTGKFWAEVKSYEDAAGERPYSILGDFATLLLVLPWSNADVERAFSIMKIVKDPRRNRMKNVLLNAILTIRAGLRRLGKCCHNYEYPKAVLQEMACWGASFLLLVVLEAGNTAAIVKGTKEELARYKLDIQKMRGLGSDNASVVTGCHDGVFGMLQREVPHLILVRCVCHSVQRQTTGKTNGRGQGAAPCSAGHN
ncbi:hypothetical protein FOCC_FOCC017682 [Frankliniella occidentalis]|nr:hypothetical protein FOCC_FOCC017682 [Frankliniella occidentalis]